MYFSIIIPLYNRPQELDELLDTLTKQGYKDFEVLVIEDGSRDDAAHVVEKYRQELDLHYYIKENGGQGFARNFAFERARGDYFIIFDSDCLIPANYLQVVYDTVKSRGLDAYGGPDAAHESFTPVQKAISYAMTSVFTTGGIRGNKKHMGEFTPRSFNMGLSRKVWETVGGFKITRLGEDIEYSLRIKAAGFKTGLIENAYVYHKRRTNFKQFYKQLHFFGRARINIYKFFNKELKPVHFFPAVFTIGLGLTILANIMMWPVRHVFNAAYLLYFALIFFDSLFKNRSLKVAVLSMVAAGVQLTAYGMGFIQDFIKRVVLGNA